MDRGSGERLNVVRSGLSVGVRSVSLLITERSSIYGRDFDAGKGIFPAKDSVGHLQAAVDVFISNGHAIVGYFPLFEKCSRRLESELLHSSGPLSGCF